MSVDTCWYFPPTNGGRIDGFNDPGIAHFNGSPLSSLARETIQNSLDARKAMEEPVSVSFELIELGTENIGGDELLRAVSACKQEADDDPRAEPALLAMEKMLGRDKVPCLRVSDRNTTGLNGKHWQALVKMQGTSFKNAELQGAGGSHGIGKYAPFTVSKLRTVFYWTSYKEKGKEVEQFQGKSVLMSHDDADGEQTQGTGFYGLKAGCKELRGADNIPRYFRLLTTENAPVYGTSLIIAGFEQTEDWRRRVASSVIENYFYAIEHNNLSVTIEPDEATQEGMLDIDAQSLEKWFDYLEEDGGDSFGDEDGSSLKQARDFWEVSRGNSLPTAERQDPVLGHCRLWIRVAEGLPSKVAFVRRTGMLVTTEQSRLKRFPGFKNFAALCVFEDPEGNELLRQMENPQHDQFEPDRLPDDMKDRGRDALKRITDWIRARVKEEAGPRENGKATVLSELAALLPDLHPEESFEDEGQGNSESRKSGFDGGVMISLKPIRRPPSRIQPDTGGEESEGEGPGEDSGSAGGGGTGTNAGGGGTGGSGEGEGQGGTGGRSGSPVGKGVSVSNVRILPAGGSENHYHVSFKAEGSGVVKLELQEAGDSSAIPRDDIRAVSGSLDKVKLVAGRRTHLEITADTPIGNRAWRVVAVKVEEGDQ